VARLFYGWVVVAGAFVTLFVAYGAQYSFGVFFAALLEEFGWRRASLAGAFSLYAFAYCLFGFPAGRLTDRWGPRAVIASGGLFLGGALAGMSLVTRVWEPYLLYGIVAALGMGTAYVPCNATVVKWFVRRRGLAAGLASSGASFGTLVLPPLAQVLIARVGWRGAYVAFGLGVLVVLNVVALVMRRDPERHGLHPDGGGVPPPVSAAGPGLSLASAVRTPVFWLVWAAFAAIWIPVFIPLVHVVQLARDLGFAPLVGATVISILGVGAIAGRLIMGGLSDRIGRKPVIAASMIVQALAFAAFAGVRDLWALSATAFAYGYAYGAISTLFTPLVSDLFGREHAGALVGVLFALAGSMGGLGPVLAGLVYDTTGAYGPAFWAAAALSLVAVAILLRCRPATAVLGSAP
jgi:MFS family permease